jgi:hypothetical protein
VRIPSEHFADGLIAFQMQRWAEVSESTEVSAGERRKARNKLLKAIKTYPEIAESCGLRAEPACESEQNGTETSVRYEK